MRLEFVKFQINSEKIDSRSKSELCLICEDELISGVEFVRIKYPKRGSKIICTKCLEAMQLVATHDRAIEHLARWESRQND